MNIQNVSSGRLFVQPAVKCRRGTVDVDTRDHLLGGGPGPLGEWAILGTFLSPL